MFCIIDFIRVREKCKNARLAEHFLCRHLCRNLSSRVHFSVKVILIDFQFKVKDVYICSCSIDVTVTSQNGVPYFHMYQRAYNVVVLFSPIVFILLVVCCIEMVRTRL